MSSIRQNPRPSKYIINEESGGKDRYWSKTTTYDDLLFAHGQQTKDYVDLSHLAKGLLYSRMGITESTQKSPLVEYVTGEGGVETVDKNFVRWRIYGQPERRAMSFGNLNSGDYIGEGGTPFYYWADVDWYTEGDILAPLVNKRAQIVIQSNEAVPFDGGYRYEAVLLDGSDDAFLPPEYLSGNNYWIKTGALTGWEKMGQTGSIQFGEGFAYIEFEVPLTTMAWEFEVDGEAHRQWGNIEIIALDDEDRPVISRETNYLELRANAQIDMEKEYFLTYGTMSNHLIDRRSGKPITTGPGLFEFQEEGNIIPYDPEVSNLDFMVSHIEAFWFDRIPVNQREITLLTGQAGLKIWSEWVEQKFGNTAATYTYDFILQQRDPFDTATGRGGYAFSKPQFVEYVLPTFGTIRIAHWPLLDNTRISTVKYPGSIYPVTSYEFHAFNIGFGEPNVKFLQRADNKIQTYIPGLWSPYGATGQDNPVFKVAAYMEESYKWMHKESFGVVLLDPSAALRFVPNVTY